MLTHIFYELTMLVGTRRLKGMRLGAESPEQAAGIGRLLSNMIVESRALHGRNVAEFLLGSNKRQNSISAQDYVPTYAVPEPAHAELKRVSDRVGREIAHITTDRISDEEHFSGKGDKGWPAELFAALAEESTKFVEQLLAAPDWRDAPEATVLGELLDALRAEATASRSEAGS